MNKNIRKVVVSGYEIDFFGLLKDVKNYDNTRRVTALSIILKNTSNIYEFNFKKHKKKPCYFVLCSIFYAIVSTK